MITSFSDMYEAISDIIVAATGVPIAILADQGRQEPSGLYATYKIHPIRAVGTPKLSRAAIPALDPIDAELAGHEDIRETVISQFECMVSVNFLNEGARDAAYKMHHANFRIPVQDLLRSNDIGWRYCSDVRDLTGLSQGGLKPRYQTDWHIWVETGITYDTEAAASVQVDIYDELGNLLT